MSYDVIADNEPEISNDNDHMAQNDPEGEEEEDGDNVNDTCIFKQLDQIIVEECD